MAVLYIKLTENLTAKLSCSMNSVILEFANKIQKNAKRCGKRIAGPVRELYLNDPREVQPDEILTEIYASLD